MKFTIIPLIMVVLVIALALVSGLYISQPQKIVTFTSTQTIAINGNPKNLQTITEEIAVMYSGTYTVYVFGNCTTGGGTIAITRLSNSTNYIFPANTTGALNVTITTMENQVIRTSTVTVNSSLSPQVITIENGTSTSYSTQTCPTFS